MRRAGAGVAFAVPARHGFDVRPLDRQADKIEAVCPDLFKECLVKIVAEDVSDLFIVDIHPVEYTDSPLGVGKLKRIGKDPVHSVTTPFLTFFSQFPYRIIPLCCKDCNAHYRQKVPGRRFYGKRRPK